MHIYVLRECQNVAEGASGIYKHVLIYCKLMMYPDQKLGRESRHYAVNAHFFIKISVFNAVSKFLGSFRSRPRLRIFDILIVLERGCVC